MGPGYVFQNAYLRCEALADEDLGIRVYDREKGASLARRVTLKMAPKKEKHYEKSGAETRVVAEGPVRIVVDQSFDDPPLRATQRYVLPARRRGVEIEGPTPLPALRFNPHPPHGG